MNQEFIKELADIVGESNVYSDEVMARHITFRVGGKTKYMVDITGEEELYQIAREKAYYVPADKAGMEDIKHVKSLFSQGSMV